MDISFGTIRELELSADWTKFTTKPIILKLQHVYVVVSPRSDFDLPRDVQRKNAIRWKENMLAGLEESKLTQEEQEDDEEEEKSFMARVLSKIVNNLQIEISEVHVRYEDESNGFTFGVQLGGVVSRTTDDNGQPCYVDSPPVLFKLTQMQELSVYLRPLARRREGEEGLTIPVRTGKQYLLPPFDFRLMFTYTRSKGEISFRLDQDVDIGLTCTRFQMECLMRMVSSFTIAHETIIEQENKRQKMFFRSGTEEEGRQYISLYKRLLRSRSNRKHPSLTQKEKDAFKMLEHDLVYDDLRSWRITAIIQLQKETAAVGLTAKGTNPSSARSLSAVGGILSGKFRRKSSKSTFSSKVSNIFAKKKSSVTSEADSPVDEDEAEADDFWLTEDEKEEVLKDLNFTPNMFRGLTKMTFEYRIRRIFCSLLTDTDQDIVASVPLMHIEMAHNHTTLTFQRPGYHTQIVSARVTIQSVVAREAITKNSLFPELLSHSNQVGRDGEENLPLLDIDFVLYRHTPNNQSAQISSSADSGSFSIPPPMGQDTSLPCSGTSASHKLQIVEETKSFRRGSSLEIKTEGFTVSINCEDLYV